MPQHPRPIQLATDHDRLFPERFDVVRISLVIELHNIPGHADAMLRVYGGPHGKPLLVEDWTDVDHAALDVLWADLAAQVCIVLDDCASPF